MKKTVKKALCRLRNRFIRPLLRRLEQQENMMRVLAEANFRTRVMVKKALGKPIQVVFVCHEPALWSMFESVYHAMAEDPSFSPSVVALPYRHRTLPRGQHKDAGMREFCQARKIDVISGYDKEKNEWLNPASLMPDYVFFQTPYPLFPPVWSVVSISTLARVCYIPYATCIFTGDVDEIIHPEEFFKYVHLFLKEGPISKELFFDRYRNRPAWFRTDSVVQSGHPKLDFVTENRTFSSEIWKSTQDMNVKRILWTPRWNTWEGTCHFFDYREFFFRFCKENHCVSFIFRPHPLCMQNFIHTGEMSVDEQANMKREYERSANMTIDSSGNYHDTFMTSDLLITDLSTMMLEYFITGKPIVYTHRRDNFNALGRELGRGCYWVKSVDELEKTLKMLLDGVDPLAGTRKEIIERIFYIPCGGAGNSIKTILGQDYGILS